MQQTTETTWYKVPFFHHFFGKTSLTVGEQRYNERGMLFEMSFQEV